MESTPLYDSIGRNYSAGRQEDPCIARAIWSALGDAESVVNIGAGTGSYEPRDREVLAIEPSSIMLAQRPRDAAPAIPAFAERLPLPDASFDAATVILSLHHWRDVRRGLAELRRVVRRVAVFFLRDPAFDDSDVWWFPEYFPAASRLARGWATPVDVIAEALGPVTTSPVKIPADCRDGFDAAYWRRPEAILDPDVWRCMSSLMLMPSREREAGLSRLRDDLGNGSWHATWGHLKAKSELDLGFRVVQFRLDRSAAAREA